MATLDAQTPHSGVSVGIEGVKLSVGDLNEEQVKIFTNLTEKFRYPDQFALRAIEECGSTDMYEVQEWVRKHIADMQKVLRNMPSSDRKEDSKKEEEEENVESSISEKSQEDATGSPVDDMMISQMRDDDVHTCVSTYLYPLAVTHFTCSAML